MGLPIPYDEDFHLKDAGSTRLSPIRRSILAFVWYVDRSTTSIKGWNALCDLAPRSLEYWIGTLTQRGTSSRKSATNHILGSKRHCGALRFTRVLRGSVRGQLMTEKLLKDIADRAGANSNECILEGEPHPVAILGGIIQVRNSA
jgi:hypothetical protein